MSQAAGAPSLLKSHCPLASWRFGLWSVHNWCLFSDETTASRFDVLTQTQFAHVQEHRCPGVLRAQEVMFAPTREPSLLLFLCLGESLCVLFWLLVSLTSWIIERCSRRVAFPGSVDVRECWHPSLHTSMQVHAAAPASDVARFFVAPSITLY